MFCCLLLPRSPAVAKRISSGTARRSPAVAKIISSGTARPPQSPSYLRGAAQRAIPALVHGQLSQPEMTRVARVVSELSVVRLAHADVGGPCDMSHGFLGGTSNWIAWQSMTR
eukprot:2926801-Pyramimonas_sp.AAC.1